MEALMEERAMAGSRSKAKTKGTRGGRAASESETSGAHAREAASEWRKAAGYGAAAVASGARKAALVGKAWRARRAARTADGPGVLERFNPAKAEKGGKAGDLADRALSKLGTPGTLASKIGVGSRLTERILPGDSDSRRAEEGGGDADGVPKGSIPIPIQESIELAVPIRLAYDLCTRVEDFPEFIDRIHSAERLQDDRFELAVTVRGVPRTFEIEVFDVSPPQRIDWRCSRGIEHAGVVTFHELAPTLTHVELSIDLEHPGLIQRLTRSAHLTDRAVRADMHRFKAYAELYEDEGGDELPPPTEPEEEPPAEEPVGEEEDEQPLDEQEEEQLEDEGDEDLEAAGTQASA
jgi:uncharacterized membrane protein